MKTINTKIDLQSRQVLTTVVLLSVLGTGAIATTNAQAATATSSAASIISSAATLRSASSQVATNVSASSTAVSPLTIHSAAVNSSAQSLVQTAAPILPTSSGYPDTLPATEGDNVGSEVPVIVASTGSSAASFNLSQATQYLESQTSVEAPIAAIRMDKAIADPDSSYAIVGGLVRNDQNGFYEFSVNTATQATGNVLTFDPKGNLLNSQTLALGGNTKISGLQTVNSVNSALKIAQAAFLLDPVAAGLAVAQLTMQLSDQIMGNPTTVVKLNKDQFGRLYFVISPVTTPNLSPSVNGDQIITFTEPFILDYKPAPVTVQIYQKSADGSVTLVRTQQLAFVAGDKNLGMTDAGYYTSVAAGSVRDSFLANPGAYGDNGNYQLYTDIAIDQGNGQLIPFTTQYTPGQWIIGSATQYAANGTMYNTQGGRKSVVIGNAVMQELAGQQGINSVQLIAGYTSFDAMGQAGYTLQRVAELGTDGQPISAPTRSILGIPINYQVQETPWKLVAPAIVNSQSVTKPQEVEMGRLYFPTGIWSVEAGGVITAEDIRVTGLVQTGALTGYVFSVIEENGGYGYAQSTGAGNRPAPGTTVNPTTNTMTTGTISPGNSSTLSDVAPTVEKTNDTTTSSKSSSPPSAAGSLTGGLLTAIADIIVGALSTAGAFFKLW